MFRRTVRPRSGLVYADTVGRINKVTPRRAGLVLRWVTAVRGYMLCYVMERISFRCRNVTK